MRTRTMDVPLSITRQFVQATPTAAKFYIRKQFVQLIMYTLNFTSKFILYDNKNYWYIDD